MNSKYTVFLFIIIGIVILFSTSCMAGTPGARRLAVSDAMLNMMDAMGLFGTAPSNAQGFMGLAGGGSPLAQSAGDMMKNIISAPQISAKLPARTILEGTWYGQAGEWLAFKDSRFRLLAGAKRGAEGIVYMRDELIAFHNPTLNKTWVFEYAHQQDRLVLRDAQQRLYLFRRVNAPMAPSKRKTGTDEEMDVKTENSASDG